MKRHSRRWVLLSAGVLLLILAVVAGVGTLLRSEMVKMRLSAAENSLFYYTEKITLQLHGTMNEAKTLAQIALVMGETETDWFERASEPLLARDEVRFVCLFQGDTLVSSLPESEYGALVGRDLQEFSYAFTLAKVVKDTIVEGPVTPDFDPAQQKVFLFLQPVVDHENSYLGEVAVALDQDYVLAQLGLEDLSAQGYDYELWRVEPQGGAKEVIVSTNPSMDFSQAKKSTFYLPSQWNLSLQPADGWFSPAQKTILTLACVLLTCILLVLAYLAYRLFLREREKKRRDSIDPATGLYNQKGFTNALDTWLSANRDSVMLFYFSLEGFDQAARLMGPTQETAFLCSLSDRFNEYIRKPFMAGRLGAGNFVVAVREEMGEGQRQDFARGLSLELLLKVRINHEKNFIMARYQCSRCQSGGRAEEEIAALLHAYYAKIAQESPARMLTQKCNQLIEGNSNVVFDEYTDAEMTELSKTLNRYRKRVEELVYRDPVFKVGNRPKYFRDTDVLISYDAKRRFSLFCVDICAFSQYNELFSTDVGDAILHEVLRRLSRPLGTYLYRINGDVFLGITLSEENTETLAARLYQMLISPITVGNATLPLQVRLAACQYPAHGATPGALLDHLQSAIRFSKESGQNIVFYNDTLDELLRTEADILHRLNDAIQQQTLEVWYQPIVHLETGRCSAAEALVRLPDGKGGYYSAGQVISLAERNDLVEALGDYVLNSVCAFMRTCGDSMGLRRISVNLSVQQLLIGNSAEHLLNLIRTAGMDPHRFTLEVTESILIQSIDHTAETLKLLRQAGIHIALDDFGVGYSSLNYLSNLPVDIIKIDRSLTKQILTNEKQHALLRTIVEMALINDLMVVAEGVETEAEQKLIASTGVQYIQGFYYTRPMPEEKLTSFLKERRK